MDSWFEHLMINLIISFLIHPTPVWVYRYLIRKNPVAPKEAKRIVIIDAIIVTVIMIIITALNEGSRISFVAVLLWSRVCYYFLTDGFVESTPVLTESEKNDMQFGDNNSDSSSKNSIEPSASEKSSVLLEAITPDDHACQCPNCGAVQNNNRITCYKCGARILTVDDLIKKSKRGWVPEDTTQGAQPNEQETYLIETEDGYMVRVPADRLESWQKAQKEHGNDPLTPEEQAIVDRIVAKTFGPKNEQDKTNQPPQEKWNKTQRPWRSSIMYTVETEDGGLISLTPEQMDIYAKTSREQQNGHGNDSLTPEKQQSKERIMNDAHGCDYDGSVLSGSPQKQYSQEPEKGENKKKKRTAYCKRCGGIIDPHSKKCDSCGKQYFRAKKAIAIILACVIILGLTAVNIFQYFDRQKYIARLDTIRSGLVDESIDNLSLRKENESLQNQLDGLTAELKQAKNDGRYYTNCYNKLCDIFQKGNLGYASDHFHASESVIILNQTDTGRTFTLTAFWEDGGTVSIEYSPFWPPAYVEFDNDTWNTSTTVSVTPDHAGVGEVIFSNSVDQEVFRVVIIVIDNSI